MTDERNRQSPGGPQPTDPRRQAPERQDKERIEKERGGKEHMGDKPRNPTRPGSGGTDPSRGLVGQDTDGDGKVVQPGQPPGQSHGTGHIKK